MSHAMGECTNYAGVDLTRHPALKEAYRIACLIEACGASPELTTASCAAFDFIRTLDAALPASAPPPPVSRAQAMSEWETTCAPTNTAQCNCAGIAPTMPTYRTEHLPTCPCSRLTKVGE